MRLTSPQTFILYTLGRCTIACNQRFKHKPLAVSFSKAAFIELARAANLTHKKERALYKNLEALERLNLLSYTNKNLTLTKKGQRHYQRTLRTLQPYLVITQHLIREKNLLKYAKKARTVLKRG